MQLIWMLLTAMALGLALRTVSAAGNGAIQISIAPATPPQTAVQLAGQTYTDNQQPAGKSVALPPLPLTPPGAKLADAVSPASSHAAAAAAYGALAGQQDTIEGEPTADVAAEGLLAGEQEADEGESTAAVGTEAAGLDEPTLLSSTAGPEAQSTAANAAAAAVTVGNTAASAQTTATTASVPVRAKAAVPRGTAKDVTAAVIAAGIPVPTAASGATIVHYVNPNVTPTKQKPTQAVTATAAAVAVAEPQMAQTPPQLAATHSSSVQAVDVKASKASGTGTTSQPAKVTVAPKTRQPAGASTSSLESTTASGLHISVGSSSTTAMHGAPAGVVAVASAPIVAAATPTMTAAQTGSNQTSLGSARGVLDAAAVAPAAHGSLPATVHLPGPTVKPPPPFIFKQKGATKMVKIGCSLPFEGSQKSAGEAVFQAMRMAITEVAPRELPGVNVNLTCLNSKCDDVPAYQAVNDFADDKAVAVVGDICSRASVAAAGVGNARKLVVISPASTSPSLSDIDYFYRTVPSDRFQGVAAAHLMRTHGLNTIGIAYEDSAYGFGLAFNLIAAFTKDGGTVPVTYKFATGEGDAKAAATQMKQGMKDSKLDAVIISTSNLTFAADFLVAAKSVGLTVPVYGGDALADYTLFQYVKGRPSVIKNLTTLSVAPGSKEFIAAYSRFTKTQPSVGYQAYAAHAYDAIVAVLKAYKGAAAPKDGAAIKQQMYKLKFQGTAGPILFDKYGDLIPDDRTYVYVKFNATNGARMVKGFVTNNGTQKA